MIAILRKRLKPYQWPLTWGLFALPWVIALALAFDLRRALLVLGTLCFIALWAFLLDTFRQWLDAAP